MERNGIQIKMEPGDAALLKEHTVDFISFSYYSSRVSTTDNELLEQTAGISLLLSKIHIWKQVNGVGKLIH